MGRIFKRDADAPEDRDADLGEDEHAWWARREEINAVPRGDRRNVEEPPPADSTFNDYWTAESLFDEPPATLRSEPAPEDVPAEPAHGMDLDAAHLVLQVPIGADWDDITAAHRRLAKLYHPDRLVELSAEAQDVGRQRMAEINAAHASLRALHFH